ncbi:hypothetical protein BpHYR1_020017 [Brachionus plicatilis]|uniref:Uncharacterized protein n=1 Tax=Brachionus plicatilis TaxID=10195 RepID=A0A3M7PI69_BRAPC|nr:hypothetical protein BpHYR1_020017 [Brachionus plicatilis]
MSIEKSCSVVFSKYKKESDNLNLKIYLQAIQNAAVRSILRLKYDTPSNIMHQEAFNKLKLLTNY